MLPLVVLTVCLSSASAFAQSCNCEVSPHKEQAYDLLLFLTPEERQTAEKTHLPWGGAAPARRCNQRAAAASGALPDRVRRRPASTDLGRLSLRDDDVVSRSRNDCFRRDPRIASGTAASFCEDYEEPVFDRGHMVPRADMNRSEAAMIKYLCLHEHRSPARHIQPEDLGKPRIARPGLGQAPRRSLRHHRSGV